MINRTIQPKVTKIKTVDFVSPKKYFVSDNCSMFHMKDVTDDTVRLDLYFDAGKIRGKSGIASFVNGVLLSGTAQKTSAEINEIVNGLGGFYNSGVSSENSVISIYCLREHLVEIFDTILDAIQHLSFEEKEVREFLSDVKQQFKINSEKVSYLAQRAFQQELFNNDARYSSVITKEDIENVQIDDLKSFHQEHYLKGLSKIVLVGNVPEKEVKYIIDATQSMALNHSLEFAKNLQNKPGKKFVQKKDAIQSAIRVGKILFNKKHEDYLDFLILNTILGDYFGSRLMSNIREDKGYTYGIGSMMAELEENGYFLIATEVNHEVKEETLTEIQKEFKRLQTDFVPQNELKLVQNYMLGQLLKSADGPYAMMDLFLSVEAQNLDLELYNTAIQKIQEITPERIQELAVKYLNWEDFTVVVAG